MSNQDSHLVMSPAAAVRSHSLVASLIASASTSQYSVFMPDISRMSTPISSPSAVHAAFAAPALPLHLFGDQPFSSDMGMLQFDKQSALVDREPWLMQRPFENALQMAMLHARMAAPRAHDALIAQFL